MPLIPAIVAAVLAVATSERGTVVVTPGEPGVTAIFADAVESALTRAGFTLIAGPAPARHVATLEVTRTVRGITRTKGARPKPTAGGGMVFGNAAGVGVSIPFGSEAVNGQLVGTELTLRIARPGSVWEGRAITYQVGGSRGDDPAALAKKLSAAILRNYDSPTGVLVSVP